MKDCSQSTAHRCQDISSFSTSNTGYWPHPPWACRLSAVLSQALQSPLLQLKKCAERSFHSGGPATCQMSVHVASFVYPVQRWSVIRFILKVIVTIKRGSAPVGVRRLIDNLCLCDVSVFQSNSALLAYRQLSVNSPELIRVRL